MFQPVPLRVKIGIEKMIDALYANIEDLYAQNGMTEGELHTDIVKVKAWLDAQK